MNAENTKQLIERFPELFKPDPKLRRNLMAFGFEHGDGWRSILWRLCGDLESMLLKLKGKKPEDYGDFQITQIKEKYGTLRFYTNWATDEMDDRIDQAEEESARTCEICGSPGEMRNAHGWYMIRCDECWEKQKEVSDESDLGV